MKKKIIKAIAGGFLVAAMAGGIMACAKDGESVETEERVINESVPEESEIEQKAEEEKSETEEKTTENEQKSFQWEVSAMDIVKEIKIGWNIGNTLDSTRDNIARVEPAFKFETAWGNPKVTQELIDTVLDSGFNLIRIPVSWKNHFGPEPEYEIVESWMERVQEVVDYAYNKGAYVILNLHHEDWNYPYYDNQEAACEKMRALWEQIAERFKDYDEHLIFEAQNEPRKIGTPLEWNGGDEEGWAVVNATNAAFVETIRNSSGKNADRMLMLPGYGANSSVGIKHIEVPEDNRIIISVHAYEPYDFALNTEGRSEWNEDKTAIDTLMNNLKELYIDKGIPVIIGEFGAMNKDNEQDRAAWAEYYTSAAAEIGVPCVWWDNGLFEGEGERFGLFDRRTYECKYKEVLAALMRGVEK